MEIDWSKAPVSAMYAKRFGTSGVDWYKKELGQWYRWFDGRGWERAFNWDNKLWNGEIFVRPEFEVTTVDKIQQLRSLVQESGLQIEFHANGDIYVWDDTYEEGTKVNSLDEYVRLAEAKAAYVKLWADYIWE